MSQSEYSPSAGKQRLDDTGRDDIDEAVLKERAAKLEAKAVDAKGRAQAARRNMLADAQAAEAKAVLRRWTPRPECKPPDEICSPMRRQPATPLPSSAA
jgi:hypothetical protein